MKCPLCQEEMLPQANEYYKDLPSFECPKPYPASFRNTHYLKYFSADWSYSHYREEAYVMPFRILNLYNYRTGKSDFGAIQEYRLREHTVRHFTRYEFQSLLRFDHCLPIPSQQKFLSKIKTLLVFS